MSETPIHPRPVPAVGRIVHYYSRGSADGVFGSVARAAIITAVDDRDGLSLAVLNPTGLFFDRDVPYSDEGKPGTWTWPPRV